ncbi:DUF732 domain-containing protein [Mycobacterium vicinigordonae]|uniref:DUF732 domain-containing protein n=1 Tax=Mycobacterium vicinigordonae TaxID=1719132 RepID=A0A7D6I5C5_9MYCO|nr:DUF732 domain-containing protein [Mycobacterium vicinigordonae]QLL10374.1 DUF732 domain-containing protein [Mycobacterium vicinigordonae]
MSPRMLAIFAVVLIAGTITATMVPQASAAPAPEVEYVYDVMVRRHYDFPGHADAVNYGYGICDKVGRGDSYARVMTDTRSEVVPSDEFAANYLISYAVNLLCPDLIWLLRNSAAYYRPPAP